MQPSTGGPSTGGPSEELVLGGKYLIDWSTNLGTGGFSAGVFAGREVGGTACAIKLTNDEIRYEREVHTLQHFRNSSQYVQQLLDYSQDEDGSPCEIDGRCWTVQQLGHVSLDRHLRNCSHRPIPDAAVVCRDLLAALAHLHRFGFAHLDVRQPDLNLCRRLGILVRQTDSMLL